MPDITKDPLEDFLVKKDYTVPQEQVSPEHTIAQSIQLDAFKELSKNSQILKGDDITKGLADSQSWYEQAAHGAGRVVTDFLGGTIESFGSTAQMIPTIVDKVKGQDSDFSNGLMQLGQDIQDWGKKNMPIYHEHPNSSWDVKDPAWWVEGIESAFSTLQFIPLVETGAGALTLMDKFINAEKLLGKIGMEAGAVNKLKYFSKVGVGAVLSRNAENMQAAFLMRQNTKQSLLDEYKNNPDELEKLKELPIYDEFMNSGNHDKTFNAENVSNFLAGRAGWTDYTTNAANVFFDAVQLVPLFKGFDANTRKGFFGTSNKVRNAEESLATGVAKKYSFAQRLGDYLNPMVSGVGRSASEGVEEWINDMADNEAKNQVEQDKGKATPSFADRVIQYLQTPSMYESAFWGVAGGALFEGMSHGISHLKGGETSNSSNDYRVNEILSRPEQIKFQAQLEKQIIDNPNLSDEDKKEQLANIKAGATHDMAMTAAKAGNINGLINFVKSPEFKKQIVEQGISTSENADKAIAKTIDDILLTEQLYKKHFNSFFHTDVNDAIKDGLISKSAETDFHLQKNKQQITKKETELADMKANNQYMQNSKEVNVESSIHLEALEQHKEQIEDLIASELKSNNRVLINSLNKELETTNQKIDDTKELIGDKKASLLDVEDIIQKQAELYGVNFANTYHQDVIGELKSPKNIKETVEAFDAKVEELKKKDLETFKTNIDTKIKEHQEAKKPLNDLILDLAETNKKEANNTKKQYVSDKIKELKTQEFNQKKATNVQQAKETQPTVEPVNPPVSNKDETQPDNSIENYTPQELTADELKKLGDTKLGIDTAFENKNKQQLQDMWDFDSARVARGVVKGTNIQEQIKYAKNKHYELLQQEKENQEVVDTNEDIKQNEEEQFEIIEENNIETEVPKTKQGLPISTETLFNPPTTKPDIEEQVKQDTLDKLSNPSKLHNPNTKRVRNISSLRLYLPLFNTFAKGYDANHWFSKKNGNIQLNKNADELVKTLAGLDFKNGSEVELKIDTKNPLHNQNKNNHENIPITLYFKGVEIGYLPTVAETLRVINSDEHKNNKWLIDKLNQELQYTRALRENFKGENSTKTFVSTITYKGNGTLISRWEEGKPSYRNITKDEIAKGIYMIPKGGEMSLTNLLDTTKQITFANKAKSEEHQAARRGRLYLNLVSWNGTEIPVPTMISKLTKEDAKVVNNYIKQLSELVSQGLDNNNDEVKEYKEIISKYIRRGYIDNLVTQYLDNGDVIGTLENMYFNIDIRRLQSKDEFTINHKTYDTYLDYILGDENREGRIKTDVANILDSKGNVVTQFLGFGNDFSLEFDSNIVEKGNNVDKLSNLSKKLTPEEVEFEFKVVNNIQNNLQKVNQWYKQIGNTDTFWNKLQKDLQIPKEQIELLKNSEGNTIEEKLVDFVAKYSYNVEINTTKGVGEAFTNRFGEQDALVPMDWKPEYDDKVNSSFYSNLTVPGGTNYTENEISTPAITPSIKGHAQFSTDNGIGWFRSDEKAGTFKEDDVEDETFGKLEGGVRTTDKVDGTKTRRILEVQSDLFQKGRDKADLATKDYGLDLDFYRENFDTVEEMKEYEKTAMMNENKSSQNQFLQLLNKDNNWVTFFVKSIIQDSAKKGYEKVLFPSGNTASKVEGHTTLEEFLKEKQTRLDAITKRFNDIQQYDVREEEDKGGKFYRNYINNEAQNGTFLTKEKGEEDLKRRSNVYIVEIDQLKSEIKNVQDNGFGALNPIYNFYENTIKNILKKSYSIKEITDEYGSTWSEIQVTQNTQLVNKLKFLLLKQQSNIHYEKELSNQELTSKDQSFRINYTISDSKQALKDILKNPLNTNIKEISEWLQNHISKNNVKIVNSSELQSNEPARYNVTTNTILINSNYQFSEGLFQQSVLHEIFHALTISPLYNNMVFGNHSLNDINEVPLQYMTDFEFKKHTPQYVKDFVTEMVGIFQDVTKQLQIKHSNSAYNLRTNDEKTFYGLTNVQEFISEIMTNPSFRNEVRQLQGKENSNLIDRIYNKIVNFLNKVFGTNIDLRRTNILETSINNIKDFIEKTETIDKNIDIQTSDILNNLSIKRNPYNNELDSTTITNTINTIKGNILICKQNQIPNKEIKEVVKGVLQIKLDRNTPNSCKYKMTKVLEHFDTLYNETSKEINRTYKTNKEEDDSETINEIEKEKSWEQDAELAISSQQNVGQAIKMAVETIIQQKTYTGKIDSNGNPEFNNIIVTSTGLNRFVEFHKIYPFLLKCVNGSNNYNEIIQNLRNYSVVIPEFSELAEKMLNNVTLLAQVDSTIAKLGRNNSKIKLYTLLNDILKVNIQDELRNSDIAVQFQKEWNENINIIIDKLTKDRIVNEDKTVSESKEHREFKSKQDLLFEELTNINNKWNSTLSNYNKSKNIAGNETNIPENVKNDRIKLWNNFINDNKENLISTIIQIANNLNIKLLNITIQTELEKSNSLNDFKLTDLLEKVNTNVIKGIKGQSNGYLRKIGNIEKEFTLDAAENSSLSIKGKPLFGFRNSSFLSNFIDFIHSEDKAEREEVLKYFKTLDNIPQFEYSNWLKSTYKIGKDGSRNKVREGFLNTDKDGNLVLNDSYLRQFNYTVNGGSKEVLSEIVKNYIDFTDKEWMIEDLMNHINQNEFKDGSIIQQVQLTPADKSVSGVFEVAKIKLTKDDLIPTGEVNETTGFPNYKQGVININSQLYRAIYNTSLQELRTIQQATQQVFDIVNDRLVPKKDLDFQYLEKTFHYKELVYNSDGTINTDKTLLDRGKPTGSGFYFHNAKYVDKDGKVHTINDKVEGIIAIGYTDKADLHLINNFTKEFIKNTVDKAIKDFYFVKKDNLIKFIDRNTGDGSFESLITEFVLNRYVHNVEQAMFFNGTLSEYKDGETFVKRTGQLSTTAVRLSSEAMKMKLGIHNYNGETFKGVTFKDIKLPSKTINDIISMFKKYHIKNKSYTSGDKKSFNVDNILQGKTKNLNNLEKDVYESAKGYLKIESTDGQGYITLDQLELLLRGRGLFDNYSSLFRTIRAGKELSINEINILSDATERVFDVLSDSKESISAQKPFLYGRNYDINTNRLISTQLKLSVLPLIPQLVYGTELEKIMNWMNNKGIGHTFFESAIKVGVKLVHDIADKNQIINEEKLNSIQPDTYYYKDYGIQLDNPDKLVDEDVTQGTQILKSIISDIRDETVYNVGGKDYNGVALKDHLFNLQVQNAQQSSDELLKELGVKYDENGKPNITDENFSKILQKAFDRQAVSKNFELSNSLDENNKLELPLPTPGTSSKNEGFLMSLFIKRVIKQKISGASVVMASRMFLDNKKSLDISKYEGKGIEWSKEKENDRTLHYWKEDKDATLVVEVVLGAWSKEFYNNGKRISIDDIPDDIKTMIGYRIPSTAKHSMVVFKVVGFLPDEENQIILAPDDINNQTGSDFDIDKLNIMYKNFYRDSNDNFIVPKYGKEKIELHRLIKDRQLLRKYQNDKFKDLTDEEVNKILESDETTDKLVSNLTSQPLEVNLNEKVDKEVENKVKDMDKRIFELNSRNSNREARENEIIDIFKAILTHPDHIAQIMTPASSIDIDSIADEVQKIKGETNNSINYLTEEGQRIARSRNIQGKALTAIAANFNAFLNIAQHSRMKLNDKLVVKWAYKLDNTKDTKYYKDRYKDKVEFESKKGYAVVSHSDFGIRPDGEFLNAEDEQITDKSAQGVVSAVDNGKKPSLNKLNLNTKTYPSFHTQILCGVPIKLAGIFMTMPSIVKYVELANDKDSMFNKSTGNPLSVVKRRYQTILYDALIAQDKTNINEKYQAKRFNKKVLDEQGNPSKIAITNTNDSKDFLYFGNDVSDRDNWAKEIENVLKYNPNEERVFAYEELENILEQQAKGISKLSKEEYINYITTQLQILETFERLLQIGNSTNSLLLALKTDSSNRKAALISVHKLNEQVENLRNDEGILIDDKPAINSLFPVNIDINSQNVNLEDLEKTSLFAPLEYYYKTLQLAEKLIGDKFITNSVSYKNVYDKIKGTLRRNLDERSTTKLFNLLTTVQLNDFNYFKTLDRNRILGINSTELSTAQKVKKLQDEMFNYLSLNPQHILNFLNPKIDEESIAKNGYHKIDLDFWKSEQTDDIVADSIYRDLLEYEEGSLEYQVGKELIDYNFITEGLNFGRNSYRKGIPNQYLIDIGLGDYINQRLQLANKGQVFTDNNIIDTYFRNSWNNNSVVPIVTTKTIKNDDDTFTVSGVDWLPNKDGVIKVKQFEFNQLDFKIKNSPYLLVKENGESLLYKKYTQESEMGNISSFNGITYYYPVNKLGRNNIVEDSNKSMFEDNNTKFNINKAIGSIETEIQELQNQKEKNGYKGENKTQEDIDEQTNKCEF